MKCWGRLLPQLDPRGLGLLDLRLDLWSRRGKRYRLDWQLTVRVRKTEDVGFVLLLHRLLPVVDGASPAPGNWVPH